MQKYMPYTLIALLMTFFASSALANEVIFVNTHSFPIASMRLVNVNSGQGFNLLETPLAAKEGLKVRLTDNDPWNFMAVDLNGSAIRFENIRFSGVKYVYIFPNGTLEVYR